MAPPSRPGAAAAPPGLAGPVGLAKRAFVGAVHAGRWIVDQAEALPRRLPAFIADRRVDRARYRWLGAADLRAPMRSDTMFVFGSGRSLTDITPARWAHIARCNTIGFNYFVVQNFVRVDYQLIREMGVQSRDGGVERWTGVARGYCDILRRNPCFGGSILLVQAGWKALIGNRLVGWNLLPEGSPLFRFRNRRGLRPADGGPGRPDLLWHGPSTFSDCIDFAAVLGWTNVVLAGIDLYDRAYFWHARDRGFYELDGITNLGGDEYGGGGRVQLPHQTAREPLFAYVAALRERLARRGVSLWIENPRSLLASVLPVYPYAREAG